MKVSYCGLPAVASRPGLLKYNESGKYGLILQVTQKTKIFPSISHLEGIGQGGISREIPGRYFPGNTRAVFPGTTLQLVHQ